jgi:hypothetical protein
LKRELVRDRVTKGAYATPLLEEIPECSGVHAKPGRGEALWIERLQYAAWHSGDRRAAHEQKWNQDTYKPEHGVPSERLTLAAM